MRSIDDAFSRRDEQFCFPASQGKTKIYFSLRSPRLSEAGGEYR
jgi:hypothetical protein